MYNIKKNLLDIVFPRHCLGCDILLGNGSRTKSRSRQSRESGGPRRGYFVRDGTDSYLCRACLKAILFTKGFACAFCKSPVRAGKTCVYCIKDHFLDRLLVAASYENPLVGKIIKTAKYRFVRSLVDEMADLMIKYLEKRAKWLARSSFVHPPKFYESKLGRASQNLGGLIDSREVWVIPVPLHRQRLNWRGFNQAEIMAKGVGNFFGWPVAVDILRRCHNRKPQTNMPDQPSRVENAKNLFQIYADRKSIDFIGKTILLIDDVSTTGSTLNDCARALKGAGAKEVIGFVFARGKLDRKS